MDCLNFQTSTSILHALQQSTQAHWGFWTSTSLLHDPPNYYKVNTHFALFKCTLWTSISFLHTLRWSKWTLWTSTSLLQALWWSKRSLQTSTRLLHAWQELKRTLRGFRAFYTLSWGQNFLLCALRGSKRPPTCFAGVKTEPLQASESFFGV